MKYHRQPQTKLIVLQRQGKFILEILAIMLLVALFACSKNGSPLSNTAANPSIFKTLQKVDDYPLYVMEYEGDYQFNRYLLTGTWPELSLSVPEGMSSGDWGCTCFSAMGDQNTRILGRNFDWHDCIPLVLYTRPPNAFASVSMVDLEYFGFNRENLPDNSVNQEQLLYTPYLPFDGMNEKGVAVGMMAISDARGPFDGEKVTIGEIEVIRLILDYAANVEEALQLMQNYNIQFTQPPIHYMISDRSGESVIVEFINGNIYTRTSTDSIHVSTNFILHGSQAPIHTSCWRYNTTYQSLTESQGVITFQRALSILQQASQPNTIWSTLYNLQSGVFMVVPGRKYGSPLQFELAMQQ
jgi:hypothetical protein